MNKLIISSLASYLAALLAAVGLIAGLNIIVLGHIDPKFGDEWANFQLAFTLYGLWVVPASGITFGLGLFLERKRIISLEHRAAITVSALAGLASGGFSIGVLHTLSAFIRSIPLLTVFPGMVGAFVMFVLVRRLRRWSVA